ncbi:MAG: hypothetical protein JXR97_07805 [Planctomycetes bacterium]|nr:hypothetical protein [Planctomycetota bacterium]
MNLCDSVVSVKVEPNFDFAFAPMRVGVLQHLDRDYTYDVIPDELLGGILFQGIHRPPAGTKVSITLHSPATVYFFFHHTVEGGYSEIFAGLNGWEHCGTAPQYDIHNGEHGLRMVMYKLSTQAGTYTIPPTIKDKACFNFVVHPEGDR